jgi:hypothetical protein
MVRVAPDLRLAKSGAPPPGRERSISPYVRLTANLFFRPDAPRVIALVSCSSREGVSSIGDSFLDFLTVHLRSRAVLLPASACLARAGARSSSNGASGIGLVPSELFLSAKEDADVLIVDCSSLDTSPAVFVLASHVDGVILVVEDGRHSAIEIKRAVKLIKAANGSVLGVILNKRRRLLPRWLYSLFSRTQ